MTDFETHPVGTADLLKRLRSNTPNMAIGLSRHQAAARIEQLEAELTRANAAAAAAYEVAAKAINDRGAVEQENFGLDRATQNFFRSRDIVRALATPDQTAALDRLLAEAEARGRKAVMQEAASIASYENDDHIAGQILAAIKKGGA